MLRLPAVRGGERHSLCGLLVELIPGDAGSAVTGGGGLNRTHKVIIMVDVGDLREGVWPDRVVPLVENAARLPNIEIAGLGANLACYGGVIPTPENMRTLIDCRDACRQATGLPLDMLSGGNSANLPLLMEGGMPPEINHFRIGEAIILGRNVLDRSPCRGRLRMACGSWRKLSNLKASPRSRSTTDRMPWQPG